MISEIADFELSATYSEYRDFIESNVWGDIHKELVMWIESLRDELEFEEGQEIKKIQGRISALKEVLEFPHRILSSFEARMVPPEEDEMSFWPSK